MIFIKYSELQQSEFFSFFNISEIKIEKTPELTEIRYLKPGGFQEFIDILFKIKDDEIKEAQLILERSWIGNHKKINPFGTDITKSFIEAITPSPTADPTC